MIIYKEGLSTLGTTGQQKLKEVLIKLTILLLGCEMFLKYPGISSRLGIPSEVREAD